MPKINPVAIISKRDRAGVILRAFLHRKISIRGGTAVSPSFTERRALVLLLDRTVFIGLSIGSALTIRPRMGTTILVSTATILGSPAILVLFAMILIRKGLVILRRISSVAMSHNGEPLGAGEELSFSHGHQHQIRF